MPDPKIRVINYSSKDFYIFQKGSSLFSVGGKHPEFAGGVEAVNTGFRIRLQRH